ncbi:MAG TPA: glycerophosphodiester phosphodiesterase [Candidatus Polarisedimenticolaceae bacterium]|nr:glycerophosphodiester phosphodiesterase [Candidatus Polarisedimenticolaceae bacterium]
MNRFAPFGDRVWTIAHRGASRDRPENTLVAFDEALRQGCDAIELDLQLTRDGAVVVFHDLTLARAGGGRRSLRSIDRAGLVSLGLAVPTLDEVLERYSGPTWLLLEIKQTRTERALDEIVRQTVDAVARYGARERVFLLSFDRAALERSADLDPGLRRVLNVGGRDPVDRFPAAFAGLHAVSVDVRALRPPLLAAVEAARLPLLVFTCNQTGEVERALAAGAAGVMSDRPGWLRGYLAARSAAGDGASVACGDRPIE